MSLTFSPFCSASPPFTSSRAPPDKFKTFGYQRAGVLAAFINAGTLILISLWIAVEAVHRLSIPVAVQPKLMMVVAAAGVVMNGVIAALLWGVARDVNLRSAFLHMAGDTLSTAAVIAGGAGILLTGQNWIDPVLSHPHRRAHPLYQLRHRARNPQHPAGRHAPRRFTCRDPLRHGGRRRRRQRPRFTCLEPRLVLQRACMPCDHRRYSPVGKRLYPRSSSITCCATTSTSVTPPSSLSTLAAKSWKAAWCPSKKWQAPPARATTVTLH